MRSEDRDRGGDVVQGWSLELRVPRSGAVHRATRSMLPVVGVSLRVDGIAWARVQTLESAESDDHVYAVSRADDGALVVQFGDGERGRRLPTGVERISAQYRSGRGSAGNVPEGEDTGGFESLIYVDLWTEEVSAIEDAQLREPAAGGPDTSSRGRSSGSESDRQV